MKKASKIVLIIGAVWDLLLTIGAAIAGIVVSIMALVDKAMIDPEFYDSIETMLMDMDISVDAEAIAWIVTGIFILIVLTVAFVSFVFLLVATILAFNGAKAKKNGILIANIIFGFFVENWLVIVGAILGIVGISIEKRRLEQANQEPAPAQVEAKEPEAK